MKRDWMWRSDSAVKQLLLMMDERSGGGGNFIIQDLDDHHLLIKADDHDRVKRELEAEVRTHAHTRSLAHCEQLEKNSYTQEL